MFLFSLPKKWCKLTLQGFLQFKSLGKPFSQIQSNLYLITKEIQKAPIHKIPQKINTAVKLSFTSSGRSQLKQILLKGTCSNPHTAKNYHYWFLSEYSKILQKELEILKQINEFELKPCFSFVIPVYNVEERWLDLCVQSIKNQYYPHWELCLADDKSTQSHIRKKLEEYKKSDTRIKVSYREKNGGISEATNTALSMATGDFICLMDNDDEIPSHALYEFALKLNENPGLDMIYSDEDKLTINGEHCEPFFKPDWSPEYLNQVMYTAHLTCYRKTIVDQIGSFRKEFNGAGDYDFVLRFTDLTQKIAHIPKVLYHWRKIPGSTAAEIHSKDYAMDAARRAVEDKWTRKGYRAAATINTYAGCFDLRFQLSSYPKVSILLPTAAKDMVLRGKKVNLLKNCIEKLRANTNYPNFEIIVIDNGDLTPELFQFAEKNIDVRITYSDSKINIAKKINLGLEKATGEYSLVFNDDIEPIRPDWLTALVEQFQIPGVGVVGAQLHYENDHLQHIGVAFCEGLPDHVRKKFPSNDPGYYYSTVSTKNWLAVTGACLLSPTKLFRELGGFEEKLAVNYNDIDYCLKVYSKGLRCVYTPHSKLYHFESISRVASVNDQEIEYFRNKWKHITLHDPFYNETMFLSRPPNYEYRHFSF